MLNNVNEEHCFHCVMDVKETFSFFHAGMFVAWSDRFFMQPQGNTETALGAPESKILVSPPNPASHRLLSFESNVVAKFFYIFLLGPWAQFYFCMCPWALAYSGPLKWPWIVRYLEYDRFYLKILLADIVKKCFLELYNEHGFFIYFQTPMGISCSWLLVANISSLSSYFFVSRSELIADID